jgi:hypothetical protein
MVDKAMYANAPELQKEVKIGDPKSPAFVIPAHTKLRDVFIDGLYVMLVNGSPVDFRDEDYREHFVYIPFKVVPSKIHGDGNEDGNELQREINMLDALVYTDIRMTAAPPTYYDSNAVKNADLVGRPDVNVPVRLTRTGQRLQDVAYTPQGRQMPGHVAPHRDYLASVLQWQYKNAGTSTGQTMLADQVGEKTATGAKLVAQGAANQRAPENAAMSDGDVRTARIWLKLFKKNAIDERYLPIRGKSGGWDVEKYKGADLGEIGSELLVVARPGSNVPRSPEDEQNAFANALQLCGGPEGVLMLAQNAPEMLKKIEDAFRIKFDISQFDLDARQSRMRLDAMTTAVPQALSMVQATGDEGVAVQILLESAPIKKYDNHQAAIKFLIDWTKSDEAAEAHPVLQAAVDARIEELEMAMKGLQAEQMQDEAAMQQPMQEQQMAMQQQEAQAQAEQANAQAAQQMEMDAAKSEQDAAIRDEQRKAALEDKAIDQLSKEEDHRRNLELEQVRLEGQRQLAKAKPKGQSA